MSNAFDQSAFNHVVIIYLARIYDLLSVQGLGQDAINEMVLRHQRGEIIGPPPAFLMSDEE